MAKKKTFRELMQGTIDAYKHCARIEIDGNVVRIRNINTKVFHPFVTRREEIPINDQQKIIVAELIKKNYG